MQALQQRAVYLEISDQTLREIYKRATSIDIDEADS